MNDNDDAPGFKSGGGAGSSPVMDRSPERGADDVIDAYELKTVRLVCLFCRDVRMIHVPVDCDTPKEVLWECLACQERWAARK